MVFLPSTSFLSVILVLKVSGKFREKRLGKNFTHFDGDSKLRFVGHGTDTSVLLRHWEVS